MVLYLDHLFILPTHSDVIIVYIRYIFLGSYMFFLLCNIHSPKVESLCLNQIINFYLVILSSVISYSLFSYDSGVLNVFSINYCKILDQYNFGESYNLLFWRTHSISCRYCLDLDCGIKYHFVICRQDF